MKERVVVGMSGGVDSAVTAALLVEQGFEVIGVTMRIWEPPGEAARDSGGCCGLGAAEDARRVAARLSIRHYVMDFQEIFRRAVIDDYAAEYRAGRTPNPCIRCNEFVKFGALRERAEALGARRIATGHYARVRQDPETGRWLLLRAADPRKDQSYALYRLSQEQLSRTLFPLGESSKEETRRLAAALGLPVAQKPDSQEVCFIPDNDYPTFLTMLAPETASPGPIRNPKGEVIGTHPGIAFYTIGQRKRIPVASREALYVTAIEPEARAITVAPADDPSRFATEVIAAQPNLIDRERLAGCVAVSAKVRYNMKDQPALLTSEPGGRYAECVGAGPPGRIRVSFQEPQKAITPGQAVVCYAGDVVIGGGIIERVERRRGEVPAASSEERTR
jgi:tRNA-uridine 2-sulfurtransferase